MQAGLTSASLELTVRGRPIRGLELRLDRQRPGATLTGHILGLPPEDLPRVTVRGFHPGEMTEPVRADREGAYRFERLSPGEWRIQAQLANGRYTTGSVEIPSGVTSMELDLNFAAGLSLTGRVTVDGAPLSGAELHAYAKDGSKFGRTAYDGSFILHDLAAGPVTLVIFSFQGLGGVRTLHLNEDQQVAIDLATGRLSGTVFSVAGEPIGDASVSVQGLVPQFSTGFSVPGARTAADGAFEISRIVAGMYQLTVEKEGFAPAKLTVEVPAGNETDLEIQLRSPSSP
jgi:hypothetical protein